MNLLKTKRRNLSAILSTGIVLFVLAFMVYFHINREQPNTQFVDTQAHLSPNEFISLFDSINGYQAEQYVDKAIEIKGMLKKVTRREDTYTLFIDSHKDGQYIMCEMQIDQIEKIKSIQPDEIITVKGIFKGVLLDAILLNCILID
jgi:hypothetical protein